MGERYAVVMNPMGEGKGNYQAESACGRERDPWKSDDAMAKGR